jgi:hypothetical protein
MVTSSNPRPQSVTLALVVLLSTWSVAARATPEFPGVVEQTLGLTKIEIDPPQGCTLCHATDAGGTALRTFGELLQQYGTQPYQDSTLVAALAEVGQKEPQLIADIKAGNDPNDDPQASALPTPEYGCAASRAGAPELSGWLLAVTALTGMELRRRRRVRSAR